MASEAQAELDAIVDAQTAAARTTRAPLWYLLAWGLVVGALVFAFSTGAPLLCSLTVIATTVVRVGAAALLARNRGIRIVRSITEPGGWPELLATLAVFAVLAVGGNLLTARAGLQLWPAVAAALIAAAATVAQAWAHERVRLRTVATANRPAPAP